MPRSSERRRPVSHPGFRPDIEGLRAVAVLLVIANHLGWLGGGYVGVDVFFVISGFLITSLLVREAEHTGRISFVGFYQRRARRILPAAIAVLIATNVTAHLVFLASRAHQTAVDSWWALGFLANVHFAQVGTDYFQAGLPPSLVQHYWSLSVEEQFYVVWPVLLLAVALIVRRRGTRLRLPLAVVLGVGTLVSFVWSLRQSAASPTDAYFATPARAWELGVGALIAVTAAFWARLPGWTRPVLAVAGLVAIGWSAVELDSGSAFPAPSGAVPVLGAAALIAAAAGGWALTPLTNPVSRYVGRVSYSLYLWHWPTILTVEALVPRDAGVFWPLLAITLAGLTVTSYHFIETPFRTGSIWRALRRRPTFATMRPGFASMTAVACAVAAVALYDARPTPPTVSIPGSATTVHQADADPTVVSASGDRADAIRSAVNATTIPDLDPSLDSLGYANRVGEWDSCLYTNAQNLAKCTFGSSTADAAHTIALLGDSEALNWAPALRAAATAAGWKVELLTYGQCPAFTVKVLDIAYKSSFTPTCVAHIDWALDVVRHTNPGLVLMTTSAQTIPRLASRNLGAAAQAEWYSALTSTIKSLPDPSRVRVVSSAPWETALTACAPTGKDAAKCVGTPTSEWQLTQRAEEAAAKVTGAQYVDTHLWFCTSDGLCPGFAGTTPMRWDSSHLTAQYAVGLTADFGDALDLKDMR